MQRYHAATCTSAVNNNSVGGPTARDTIRADSSSLATNFSQSSRRPSSLTAYRLKCDKEPLNSRLGPPDFHAQTPNCPEETLTREYVQSGYRETFEGLEEAREISLSQDQAFSKPVVLRCREAIRKCLRAINESRAQKRKAGQVYGVPLSGSLLTKPGIFPEQRPCSEDFKKKWIEGLSQPHKRLRSLADHVPHGYRRRSLFEVLIRNNVPLIRATWFIKVTYLNQVRPGSAGISSGPPDKTHLSRTELWTKDITEYLQHLLDEFVSRNNSHSMPHSRDRSSQMLYPMSAQNKRDPASAILDGEEPSLHFKWWYVVRLLQWHHVEGLIFPSLIVDWALRQLQEKEPLEILQLLLPIIYVVLETVVLSQTYVRTLAGVAVRFIREPSPGGSDLVDNSRRTYTTFALIEMLRYLILAVPDTFVALDCFPLPHNVVSYAANDIVSKPSEEAGKMKINSAEVASVFRSKSFDSQYQTMSFDYVVSSIQKRADNLAKAASPGYPGHSTAKALQALDKALLMGDVRGAYKYLFENVCNETVDDGWIEDVSPCLRSSLKFIGTVNTSFVCSVFFLCEWATCDYRDFRSAPPHDLKFTGRKDISQVYIASQLLKLKLRNLQSSFRCKNDKSLGGRSRSKGSSQKDDFPGRSFTGDGYEFKSRTEDKKNVSSLDILESPGPLHDILVCWIDQHEAHKRGGLKRLQLFIVELIRVGIFYPQAYVRQLIVSGIMETGATTVDQNRRKRHYRILKQLPGLFMREILEEAKIAEGSKVLEAMHVYSNERRLVLRGLGCGQYKTPVNANLSAKKRKQHAVNGSDGPSAAFVDQWKSTYSPSYMLTAMNVESDADMEELKSSISLLLQLPKHSCIDVGLDGLHGTVKRPAAPPCKDLGEGTPGCEDCRRVKRQKLNDEKSSSVRGHSPLTSDDEDIWWARKGTKYLESIKVDQPLKPCKQASRGRQKNVRKTQSLSQLAAARIEGSQGASTSHVCDSKASCPHHRTGMEGETLKSLDGIGKSLYVDVFSVGNTLKQLRYVEKRTIAVWLTTIVRQLVEETEKNAFKTGQLSRPFISVDDRSSLQWKLGEDELSIILYLMDVCGDLVLLANFLLWLLPKVFSYTSSTIHGGRNLLMPFRNTENPACEIGEAFVISSIRRYENIVIAADLLPEALSATMQRAAAVLACNGKLSGSAATAYARYLMEKYRNVASVVEWEKNFRATCDRRLLSELDSGRSLDGDLMFPLAGVEDLDGYLRQKISGNRLSRVGAGMRDVVQRHVEDALLYFLGKERKHLAVGAQKGTAVEKSDDDYQIAQKIIVGLMDCMRQTGGAAQEGDPSLVSSAVSAIVGNVGPTMAKMTDVTAGSNYLNLSFATNSLNIARRMLHIHITCLGLLKEALGERQSRVFEIALGTEASSVLAGSLAPGKASRSQFQLSPEAHDSTMVMPNEVLNNPAKPALGRAGKIVAAVSALVLGAVIYGVTSLERIVTVLRLKEGLDVIQFIRSSKSNSNGNARSTGSGALKVDISVEVYVHWFRLLVGNSRTVSNGFIVELLGEPSMLALSRMQRMLSLSLVFPPAYSIFAFVIWKPFIINTNLANREDIHQLFQSLAMAIGDAIKHLPFRDVCLRDSQGFYDIVAADTSDADFAAMLELNGLDMHLKSKAFVPLRARLFLNSIIDCRMPKSVFMQDDGNRSSGHGESKVQYAENETKLLDKLVKVLDTLQPAKFHWQWVELRLLLNEQALIEKLETHDMSLADALRSSSPGLEKAAASENENNFIEIILTRLLVRPDAVSLFAELVHLFGSSLEDSMLLQAKWFLGGHDVLFGRKTIRQRLINIAESKGLSTKVQFWKPWGWSYPGYDPPINRRDKKYEVTALEEGEVVDEGMGPKKSGKGSIQISDSEAFSGCQQHETERALVELIIPCIDQGSDDSRNTFASDLIKQLNNIEQQINAVTRGASKQIGTASFGMEGPTTKGNSRKGIRGGSPGLVRRTTGSSDSALPSPTSLRASMLLRLQLLLRLLPIICTDGEPLGRNMRHVLASVILRLLGNRVVYEDADLSFHPMLSSQSKREAESLLETAYVDLSCESLFDRLILVLHGLLSCRQPSWMKPNPGSQSTNESSKEFLRFDQEVAESLQSDLDRMQLPATIRWRIQAAMPILLPSVRCSVSCQPPSVPLALLSSLQPSISISGFSGGNLLQRTSVPLARSASNLPGKSKALSVQQDHDKEIDQWTLLEDGAGSGPSSSNTAVIGGGDHANLRASSWLKGAVRVRRTDLTYIGAVDDDS
ncbi:mediator of RNA polymerase II transcription subunit 12-like [Tripterygium wilfordii]|nr:mediator of RNA polymerase II transcription subunit 12-like [Tripterygium wilfordii]XP_038681798.1 mediator of RNA polymerase II transcription subunit 12-like [Tripterygium wilfordii]XP_038681799.1 mediator of RNA polymerase II transcription subunit 12-like [Tripterygium wilfordii]XP_038681800.1 mediator of RNA polymerase II transcription subunit 12-like [Tripterygium wilfordii]XP_038681801.1 mediator of RNA polymerase II transcription subunit 12-like [Tripterygium wilfordii]